MYETLILIGIVVLTQITKKYIFPRFGAFGIHAFTFLIAAAGVGIYQYAQHSVEFKEVLFAALNYLVVAVSVYEIILKRIGVKSVTTKLAEEA